MALYNPATHDLGFPGSSPEQYREVLTNAPIGIFTCTRQGSFVSANPAMAQMLGYENPRELLHSVTDIATQVYENPEERTRFRQILEEYKKVVDYECRFLCRDGSRLWVSITAQTIQDQNSESTLFQGFITDIEERKRGEERESRQNKILHAIAIGEPLEHALELIVKTEEFEDPESICSILLLDRENGQLLHGAAPSLPDFYNQAIHGLKIGAGAGSCGNAAYTGQLTVAADVLTHPCWSEFRDLARQADIRACWSQPVFSTRGEVIATFAIYYRQVRSPNHEDLKRIQTAADLASLAIERKQAEKALRRSNEELEELVSQRTREIEETNESLRAEISNRKQVEEDLRRSEIKFRTLYESTSDAVMLEDENGFFDCNEATLAIFGCGTKEEFYSKSPIDLSPAEQPDGSDSTELANQLFATAMEKGSLHFEWTHMRADTGETVPADVLLTAMELGGKTVFQAVVRDITEYKQKEEALRQSESYYRAIFETAGTSMLILEKDTTIALANSNFEELSGYSRQELEGKKYGTDFIHPEDVEWMKKYHSIRQQDPHAVPPNYEFRFVNRSGETRYGYLTIGMIPHATQSVISIVDITERRTAEKALERSENYYRALFETSGTAMFITNEDSILSLINSDAEKLSGYSKQEIEGKKTWTKFVHPDDLEWLEKYHRALLKDPNTTQTESEFRFINRQGETRYVYLASDRIPGTTQTLASCIDITEQKIAKERLESQLQFEKIVADISNIFVRLPSEQIHEAINYTLKQAGEFFQVGRCYVFMFSEDLKLMSNTHEWCAEDVKPQMDKIQNQSMESLPWWAEKIKKEEHVHVPDVESLPPEAEAEKQEFKSQNIRSVLSIPLVRNGKVFGFLGMDAVKEKKEWTENHVMLLRSVAEVISNAYTRFLVEQKIEYLTFHDMLTGLYNRRYLENEMNRLDTERQLPIGLIMADLNNFKLINDTSGHEAGDEMLRHTAEVLRRSCRDEDIIVRWGGDEFVVFLPQTTEEETKSIGERMKSNFKETYIEGNPISLAWGYGVKESPNMDLAETLKEADKNMYVQKHVDKEYKAQ